jgi:hypothetical protein
VLAAALARIVAIARWQMFRTEHDALKGAGLKV